MAEIGSKFEVSIEKDQNEVQCEGRTHNVIFVDVKPLGGREGLIMQIEVPLGII